MYNIKGPSKIVAKTTRRGISQTIDNYREHTKTKISDDEESTCKPVPKPIFQKKTGTTSSKHEIMTPQHMEMINFIDNSWSTVCSELELENENGAENCDAKPKIYFYKEEPSEQLHDFKPFDLEGWWGRRLYARITSTTKE